MRLFRLLCCVIAAASALVFLAGCDGAGLVPSVEPIVEPASGGGGTVKKTRIPIAVEVTVSETGSSSADGCECSACLCAFPSDDPFDLSNDTKQRERVDSRPVVYWVSDFGPGECPACDAVSGAYARGGSSWPFRLVKASRAAAPVPVEASPTFYWRDSDGDWRYWATGSAENLIGVWRTSR